MSNLVLPTLPGLAWSTFRSPEFDNITKDTASGRTFTRIKWSSPRWNIKRNYEFLRADSNQELQQLVGFFNQHYGNGDTWLFNDPDDNYVAGQQFGVGNSTTTQFQLVRTLGGFNEAVYELNGAPAIYINDWQGNQLCYSTARTNLLTYSQQFDDAAWSNVGGYGNLAAVSANTTDTVAPDGTTTADKLTFTASGTQSRRMQNCTVTNGQTYTASVYIKQGTKNTVQFYMGAGTLMNSFIQYTYSTDVFTTNGTASRKILSNGWVRLTITGVAFGSGSCPIGFVTTEDGTLYAWGAQMESGSAPTRYIATTTAAVTITDYSVASGLVTFSQAPLAAAAITWTGAYYWRCRFKKSMQEFEQFMKQLWTAKSIEFRTEKP